MFKKNNRLSPSTRLINPSINNTLFFTLKIGKNNTETNRYGFVITKKVDKRAVVRNKTKRKVRFCMEELAAKAGSGYDMLFFIKNNAVEATMESIRNSLVEVLKKNKILL